MTAGFLRLRWYLVIVHITSIWSNVRGGRKNGSAIITGILLGNPVAVCRLLSAMIFFLDITSVKAFRASRTIGHIRRD